MLDRGLAAPFGGHVLLLSESEDPLLELVLLNLHNEVGLFEVSGKLGELLVAQRLVFLAQG